MIARRSSTFENPSPSTSAGHEFSVCVHCAILCDGCPPACVNTPPTQSEFRDSEATSEYTVAEFTFDHCGKPPPTADHVLPSQRAMLFTSTSPATAILPAAYNA